MKQQWLAALGLSLGMVATAQAADQHIWIEAETGAEYNPIVVKSDLGAGQSIYLGSWKWGDYANRSASNGVITFDFYAPEAGDYKLWGRARLPWAGSKPYQVSKGDGNIADASQWVTWKADSALAAKTWGWSDSGFTAYFAKGKNTVHLVQNEGGPDLALDKILLTNVSSYVPSGAGANEPSISIENPYKSVTVEKYGQLKLVGNKLSDKNGAAVQLRGISAHGLQWFPLVPKQTIPYMAEFFGAQVIRLAMYIEDYAPTDPSDFWGGYMANKNAQLARTEAAIADAVKAGVYVMVDWHIHNTPGKYTTEANEFFKYISQKYGHLPNIIYEICNEPVSVTWSSGIKPYANTIINTIRANDPDNIIVVGTPNWSQDVDIAAQDPLNFSNIMYSFHFYAATHDINQMKSKVDAAMNAGAAIFVSEWGSSDVGTSRSNFDVAKQWMDYMNQKGLSWINWSLGNKDEASSIVKARAPLSGPWLTSDLTPAGAWLKPYFNAPQASTGGTASSVASSVASVSSVSSVAASIVSSSSSVASSVASSSAAVVTSSVFEAEAAPLSSGITKYATEIGYFDQGDNFGFQSVNLNGAYQAVIRFGTTTANTVIEVRAGSPTGAVLATLNLYSTGAYSNFTDATVNLNGASGVQNLYIVGKQGYGIGNFDRITINRR